MVIINIFLRSKYLPMQSIGWMRSGLRNANIVKRKISHPKFLLTRIPIPQKINISMKYITFETIIYISIKAQK